MKLILISGVFILLMASCAQKKAEEKVENYTLQGDTVNIPAPSGIRKVLQTDTVVRGDFQSSLQAAAIIKAIPNLYAAIAPPFSGRITRVFLKLGMRVKPGTPLFEMASPDFVEQQKNFYAARSAYITAELNLKRQADLKKNGVGSSKELEEAQSLFEINQKEYQNQSAALKIYQVNPEKMILGQALVIYSPIAGDVISNEVISGHFLKSDEPPHAVIADLSRVWVSASVKEKDISLIRNGDEAVISVASYPGRQISGKVYHIDELVDDQTQSINVLMSCENTDRTLKPGMYATATFKESPRPVTLIPLKAVLQDGERQFVFVQITPFKFIRRTIETGSEVKGKIVVRTGLEPGETIITAGGFYLQEAK